MKDRSVQTSFDDSPDIHHRFEARLIKAKIKGKKVLDIGCWTGQFLSLIENVSSTYGIDPGEEAIQFAQKNRKGSYMVGSALKLPYKDLSFDVITMWDVIEHVPKRTEKKALKEAHRVLKKGGLFALSTVTTHPISILMDPAYFLIGHRHYSQDQLSKMLEECGFRVDSVVYSGAFWSLLRENINLILKHLFSKKVDFSLLKKLTEKEYRGKGFYQIHLFCRKV